MNIGVTMRDASGRGHEVETLRGLLAVPAAETKLIRLRHDLDRKYDPNQPRAPAGQSDGGRWISDGGSASDSSTREETTTDHGARVLSLRIRSKRGERDDQHVMADDRAGLAALLHRWTAESLVGGPLEPHWRPGLFPLEETASVAR